MENLTLVIPAKKEKESLPIVLEELKKYNLKKLIVLEKNDVETINSINDNYSKLVFQINSGYGDAIRLGIENVQTEFFCIFNADGSFNPSELKNMINLINKENADLVFASRYESDWGSEDDTLVTRVGNYIFTKIGNIFFNLNITDILYTFVIGKTAHAKLLKLNQKDFRFCVELPIKAKRNQSILGTSKSHERKRIAGKKKVNALKDGFFILQHMVYLFFRR